MADDQSSMSPEELGNWCFDLSARLNAHEFLMEVMFANVFAGWPSDEALCFVEDIASPYRRPYSTGGEDEAARRAMAERTAIHLENLLQKTLTRTEQIRAARSAPGQAQA